MWQWVFANAGATIHTAFDLLAPEDVTEGQVITVGALRSTTRAVPGTAMRS
jgi:hypothetical protein